MIKLGLLVSGNLGCIVLKYLEANYPTVFVMTDKNSDDIIDLCKDKKINFFVGNPRKGRCTTFIKNKDIDVLISINYIFLINRELISLPKIIAFNIHGSLLPKYRGRTPHVWAIINNEIETGITAHQIDEGCDTGDIIEQTVIPINKNETGADVLGKYEDRYIHIINSVLQKIKTNNVVLEKQDHDKATFYGKRTPDDGQINWGWQKERIYNWVRAQAHPYPGAFVYLEDKKIIIDKISYSDSGFSYGMPNGKVLSVDPILVKTPNGVVKLEKIRDHEKQFEVNKILK
jgi:methionyl-tRNA formyltransferase